jgi:hypothetical protein
MEQPGTNALQELAASSFRVEQRSNTYPGKLVTTYHTGGNHIQESHTCGKLLQAERTQWLPISVSSQQKLSIIFAKSVCLSGYPRVRAPKPL